LCTQVSVEFTPLKDPGLFVIYATPRNDVAPGKVEEAIRSEVKRLLEEPVSAEELKRAKARAEAAYGLLEDGTAGRAMLLGYFASIADWRTADRFSSLVQQVTAADVQRVARRIFTDEALTVGHFVPTGSSPMVAQPRGKTPPSSGESFRGAHFRGPDTGRSRRDVSTPIGSSPGGVGTRPSARAGATARIVLPNGLVLLVREHHASPTFALSGVTYAGAAANPPDGGRLAELTASALTRGTAHRSRLDIAHALEDVGASLDLHAGPEDVEIAGKGLARDLGIVLDVLADVLRSASFPDGEVAKLQRETIAELDQAEDDTQARARRALMQALYPKGHPFYIYNHAEEVAGLKAIDAVAIRNFHAAKYGPGSVAIAIVGDVKADEVAATVSRLFGDWKRPVGAPAKIPDAPLREQSGSAVVFVPDKPSADVLLGHSGSVSRLDPDFYATDLACFALGGAPSSRLFRDVREERGLTYGAYADITAGRSRGPFVVTLTVNPQNLDEAVAATTADVRAFVERGVSESELRAAKDTMIGRYRVALATNQGVATTLAELESLGLGPEYVERQAELYLAVTREEAIAAARRHFHPDRLFIAIAGTYQAGPHHEALKAPAAGD
jgi:zinc protease